LKGTGFCLNGLFYFNKHDSRQRPLSDLGKSAGKALRRTQGIVNFLLLAMSKLYASYGDGVEQSSHVMLVFTAQTCGISTYSEWEGPSQNESPHHHSHAL
jgi:hypothetical protein